MPLIKMPLRRIAYMKHNLNDDTRHMMKCVEPTVEEKAGWFLIALLVALVVLLGYFLFS